MKKYTTIKFLLVLFVACFFSLVNAQNKFVQTAKLVSADVSTVDFEIIKHNNPGLVVDLAVGLWAYPLPMDFDGDGDMDLLVSCTSKPYGGLYYFENVSGDKIPVFAPAVRLAEGIQSPRLTFVNGEPRVLTPRAELKNFRTNLDKKPEGFNISSDILKKYASRSQFTATQWTVVDYENDGDLDIIIGSTDWTDYGWDNAYDANGNWTNGPLHGYVNILENINGTYVDRGALKTASGKAIESYGSPNPCFADFDGDGDLDIVCGDYINNLYWFENIGTRTNPVYAEMRYLENTQGQITMDLQMIVPSAVDWDQDGNIDLVVGDEDGRVALIRNTGIVQNHMPVFESVIYFRQKADEVKFGGLVTPYSVDWDDDGDDDIICGNSAGYIGFIENLGGNPVRWAAPRYLEADGKIIRIRAGENGSIQGPVEKNWGYTCLSVIDWDGDGLKDIIINSVWGKVEWFKNTGTPGNPKLAAKQPVKIDWGGQSPKKPAWNWWNPVNDEFCTQWRTTPYAIDWNNDGLMDLIMLDHEGYLAFFERFKNTKGDLILKPGQRIFYGTEGANFNSWNALINKDKTPGILRLNAEDNGKSGRRKFCFYDWDQDGDLDLITNGLNAIIFENQGKENGLVNLRNAGNVSNLRLAGHTNSPTIINWNNDGIRRLLVGAEDGHLYLFKKELPDIGTSNIVVVHPNPEAESGNLHNDDYTVKVRTPNGVWKDLFEYNVTVDLDNVQNASMTYFDFSGKVEVSVTKNKGKVSDVKIRPDALGIQHELSGNTVIFTLTKPQKLSIEFNGDKFHNLHLFANPLESNRPDPNDPNVIYFGPGIHQPKETSATDYRIPAGKTVYIAGGAVVKASFVCYEADNVKIIGRGIIAQSKCGIKLHKSDNIKIDGVIVLNPSSYSIFGGNSNNLQVNNFKSISSARYSDGIDLMSCSNVKINDIFSRNSDDCIAIYGHRWDYYGNAGNYSINNATLWADVAHPIFIGTHGDPEKTEYLENIHFKNICILEHDEDASQYHGCMAINAGDSIHVRNVSFENVVVEDFEEGQLLNLRVFFNKSFNTAPGKAVENISFKNITYNGRNITPSVVEGYNASGLVKNISFDNLLINGKHITNSGSGNINIRNFVENVSFK